VTTVPAHEPEPAWRMLCSDAAPAVRSHAPRRCAAVRGRQG
jgi:hypothetical protein